VRGGGEVIVDAPLERIPVWVRAGSIIVSYPAWHVADGLGDGGGEAEFDRPLVATLWGRRGSDGRPPGWPTAPAWDGTRAAGSCRPDGMSGWPTAR
jgi:hypothetical protein